MKTTINGNDLKILKVEYLSHHQLELSQILNWSLGHQTETKYCMKWRWPLMEDDLKVLKVQYLSNHWLDLSQILNLSLGDQTET